MDGLKDGSFRSAPIINVAEGCDLCKSLTLSIATVLVLWWFTVVTHIQ